MILVTGGAGYIGCHMVKALLQQSRDVLVLDNLSTGHAGAVDRRALFFPGDIQDEHMLNNIFLKYSIASVMHFAGSCYVGESIINPIKYYDNNVSAAILLFKKMLEHKVNKIIFSSTCAVYGDPAVEEKINETFKTNPVNPYGRSKLMIEQIIKDLAEVHEFKFMILRYFNVAGADPSGTIGEHHDPETHLIPSILIHLLGRKDKMVINGYDYNTKDGTCIRDFIHVNDLVNAHILALQSMLSNTQSNECYNVGTEKGYSVKEVIEMCERAAGRKADVTYVERRKGDPPELISSSKKIYHDLGWKPGYSLKEIIETAWKWHKSHPDGYIKLS